MILVILLVISILFLNIYFVSAVNPNKVIINGSDYYKNGVRWKGFGVFYYPTYSQYSNVSFSDNLMENWFIINQSYENCGLNSIDYYTNLSKLNDLNNANKTCMWNYYDAKYNNITQLVREELHHINATGFNTISTTAIISTNNIQKIMPARVNASNPPDRNALPTYTCDGLKHYLNITKQEGLVVNALMTKPAGSTTQCEPMIFYAENNSRWDMYNPEWLGCIDAIKMCNLSNSNLNDSFISYDISFEPMFFPHPIWNTPMLEAYNWYYQFFPNGDNNYVENESLNWTNRNYNLSIYNYSYNNSYYTYLKKQWEKWLTINYDSVDNAANIFSINSNDLLNLMNAPYDTPNTDHTCKPELAPDNISSAERRFMTDVVNRKFHDAIQQIKQVDPDHYITFRAYPDTVPNCIGTLPYDTREMAKNLDVVPREFYDLAEYFRSDMHNMFADVAFIRAKSIAGFSYRYASFNGKKPTDAPEGAYKNVTIYESDSEAKHTQFANLSYNATIYADLDSVTLWVYVYNISIEGDRNYPIVDYTLWNVNGSRTTDNPRVPIITNYSQPFQSSSFNVTQNITIDVDKYGNRQLTYNDSMDYIYNILYSSPNEIVGVNTVCTGKTSADDSSTIKCVGGGAIPTNKLCPLKCFNLQFNSIEIKNSDDIWQKANDGDEVFVTTGENISVRVSIGNLGEGILNKSNVNLGARNKTNALIFSNQSMNKDVLPLEDYNFTEFNLSAINETKNVYFRMFINDSSDGILAWFGEEWNITLLPLDPNKLIFINSSGSNIAWFDDKGNMVLKGTCTVQASCTATDSNSFIFKNSLGQEVAHVDSTGNLCLESGDCSDHKSNCNTPGANSFIIKDLSGTNKIYINETGALCLTGELTQNGDP